MMSETPRDQPPFGLLELDSDGTVLYYKPEGLPAETGQNGRASLVGRNFFTDLVRAVNIGEFQDQVRGFRSSHAPARVVAFTFRFEAASVPVSVLMARVREQAVGRSRETTYVLIRRA